VPSRQGRLHRRRPQREPRKRFLIFCEGRVTEPDYFSDWRRFLRNGLIQIEISPELGDPLRLVECAMSADNRARTQAKRERDANVLYDQIWCVVDVDQHPRLDDARQLADHHGIHLAVSEPCFELWALLHYQDQWAHIECSAVAETLRRHQPYYNKRLDCDALRPLYQQARARAIELDERRTRNNGGWNPSTGVWRLVDELVQSSGGLSGIAVG
jgi:hypothetical protein